MRQRVSFRHEPILLPQPVAWRIGCPCHPHCPGFGRRWPLGFRPQRDRADATGLLRRYERELNAGNTAAIAALYTADGVFMPSGAPTATGSKELQSAYAAVFSAIKLKVVFTIDELEIHGDIAFARTTSRGQVTVLANGQTQAEENRELFILRRQNHRWLIARYLFNQPRR